MMSHLRPALVVFVLLSVITGIAYPLAVTGIAQTCFPSQAEGSVLLLDGKAIGSSLLGQEVSGARYFWGRPSATTPVPYTSFNAEKGMGSSGSNLGPTNPDLVRNVRSRIDALAAADAETGYARPATDRVPVDLVTSSASGLDPHISLAAAEYQLPRVAKARGMTLDALRSIVTRHTQGRQLGILGEPVVNVVQLNLDLDSTAR